MARLLYLKESRIVACSDEEVGVMLSIRMNHSRLLMIVVAACSACRAEPQPVEVAREAQDVDVGELTAEAVPSPSIEQRAAELERKHAERESKRMQVASTYAADVKILGLDARVYRTFHGEEPGVRFDLRNNGSRSLTRVEVKVDFLDKTKKVIYSKRFVPVAVDEFTGQESRPLKPQSTWKMAPGMYLRAPSVPSEWKIGWVRTKVTDVEFGDAY